MSLLPSVAVTVPARASSEDHMLTVLCELCFSPVGCACCACGTHSSHQICHVEGCFGGCEDIDKWDDLEEVCNAVHAQCVQLMVRGIKGPRVNFSTMTAFCAHKYSM